MGMRRLGLVHKVDLDAAKVEFTKYIDLDISETRGKIHDNQSS